MAGTSKRPVEALLGWLKGAVTGAWVTLRVAADPAPESLRVGRNRVFPGKTYAVFYGEAQRQFAVQTTGMTPLVGPLTAVLDFVCARPKTTRRSWPRGDVDNYAKGVLDAVKKAGGWDDDDSVIQAHVFKRFAEPGEAAGATIHIGRLAPA